MVANRLNMTVAEFNQAIETAVTKAKVDSLTAAFEEHTRMESSTLDGIWTELKELRSEFRKEIIAYEKKMSVCRNELELDIHNELEKHYATQPELASLRNEFRSAIKEIKSKDRIQIAVIVGIAGIIQFFTTMAYMGSQIAKITGV